MKKILIATTALVATAGVAAADVTISGAGRFGLSYNNNVAVGIAKTQIEHRLRFNIDASKETDAGVTFGGRVRMQHQSGAATAGLNAANVFASYNGLKVTVGNVGGAYDDAKLQYASEIGYIGQSFGNPLGAFTGYSSGGGGFTRVGINATYSIAGFDLAASYINPNQTLATLPAGTKSELALSAAYTYNQFTLSAAIAQNGNFVANNDLYMVGVEYAVNDMANVGLVYRNNGNVVAAGNTFDDGRTVTVYGNYKMDAITFRGYVANSNGLDNTAPTRTKTAYGIGADYDLGGATLAGGVERGYAKETRANLGVKFSF